MIQTFLDRYDRSVSLGWKAVLVTMLMGSLLWFVIDFHHLKRSESVFRDVLVRELRHRSTAHWQALAERIHSQRRIARLLVQRQSFLEHVSLEWNGLVEDASAPWPVRHRKIPPWLPKKGILRDLIDAPFLFLYDVHGRLRESYAAAERPLPGGFVAEFSEGLDRVESDDAIRMVDGAAYLLTRVKGVDSVERGRGALVLVTPLDNHFLVSILQASDSDAILALLSRDGYDIAATSRPDKVAVGASVDALRQRYLIQSRPLLDDGITSDHLLQVATLMSLSEVSESQRRVEQADRGFRTVGFGILALLFIMMIHWLGRRIRSLSLAARSFSKQYLGSELPLSPGGDQLAALEKQFAAMMASIIEIQNHLEERERELTVANKSLWESLVMVKRTQAKLLETEKMAYLGGLVAGVAHEINTPVGIGITAASFLEKKCHDVQNLMEKGGLRKTDLVAFIADAVESSEMVLNNLMRAAELIRSFKQVAVDQSSEEKRRFKVGQYIQQILRSLQPRLKKTRITIFTECPDDLEYNGFPGVVSQIVTNLVENSLQHGFDPEAVGEIRLQVERAGDNIRMTYTDSGRGMTEEVKEHIFEPFFTTARNRGGSGLGLHIVFNLVTQTLGGSIHCESSPGKGVLFSLIFPGSTEEFHG
ncbi:MAG: HAMP domain-containing histidine kinase [Magnetococcales bacterium]|nr:HAMP domain-containing histidine kinase [Magnetococcales bacterium]